MAAFTTEARVRLVMQVGDTAVATTELVNRCIDDAHTLLLARLDPAVDDQNPDDALINGETQLAGAHLLRSLAGRAAAQGRKVRVGGQQLETGKQFGALMRIADDTETRAWAILAPYLMARPTRSALTTPTQSVWEHGAR
jgi:hypothetical protein